MAAQLELQLRVMDLKPCKCNILLKPCEDLPEPDEETL